MPGSQNISFAVEMVVLNTVLYESGEMLLSAIYIIHLLYKSIF